MSELQALRPVLAGIAADEVREPNVPMVVVLQEGHDLWTTILRGDTRERLHAVGVEAATIEALPSAVAAARQAQSEWAVLRDRGRGRGQAQREREAAGEALRTDVVAACRWNLRKDPAALAVLEAIGRSPGVPGLVQGLLDLALLVERHRPAFAGDATFDPGERAEAARSAASEIAAGRSKQRAAGDREAAKDLRDRAFTHLERVMAELREAGRYAFRHDRERASAFASEYLRRVRKRARRKAGARAEAAVREGAGGGVGASVREGAGAREAVSR